MTTYSFDFIIQGTVSTDGAPPDGPPDIEQPPPDIEQPPPDTEAPPPAIPPIPADAVYCGQGHPIPEPADAIASLPPGGTLVITDGSYRKAFHIQNHGATIRSQSGNPIKCFFDGQGGFGGGHRLAYGKGMIHTSDALTLIGLGFINCGSPASGTDYSNEAGVWIGDSYQAGSPEMTVLVQRCAFDNNGNGVFAADEANVTVRIAESIYGHVKPNGQNAACNGHGGAAHDNYLHGAKTEVSHSWFYGCANGHNVKSRSPVTDVHDNPCMTQDGGRALDVADGGEASFARNVVHTRTDRPQPLFGNSNMIGYAGESQTHGAKTLTMQGNTLHVSRTNSVVWCNAGSIASTGDDVQYYGSGSLTLQGNVSGLSGGSALPGAPAAPALPNPPSWAAP